MISGRDLDWFESLAGAKPAECVPVAATDKLETFFSDVLTHYRHTRQKGELHFAPNSLICISAPAGIRTPNQQIMSLLL